LLAVIRFDSLMFSFGMPLQMDFTLSLVHRKCPSGEHSYKCNDPYFSGEIKVSNGRMTCEP